MLEDNVEQSLLRQEEALDLVDKGTSSPGSGDSVALNKALKEQKVKFEVCFAFNMRNGFFHTCIDGP